MLTVREVERPLDPPAIKLEEETEMKRLLALAAGLFLCGCYDDGYYPTTYVPTYRYYGKPPAHVHYAPPRHVYRVTPYRYSGRRR
jgi:hypothetical protein